jgi:ubiquinone/menaquinone biosynthesis C-methylase UbiE
MALSKNEIVELYRRRAGRYDLSANLYYILGFREYAYRRQAVAALELGPGEVVVEIGCGTGLNFHYLHRAVGPSGRIVGVDLTDRMLQQARARVKRSGWTNVELVQTDAALYELPPRVDGILSTFALTIMPEFEQVIERSARALKPGGRFALLDLKRPEDMPRWLEWLGIWVTRPFGVTRDLLDRRPWEAMQRHFASTWMKEYFWRIAYLCVGES